ncbi:hypothetical protein CC2G_013818 [Coprinopsis cinerea AmutBmut pab1-1]|nr:hypothetical protein CC2G_013818 [Coprinopsis cinerea AmutBmut pab1-1]
MASAPFALPVRALRVAVPDYDYGWLLQFFVASLTSSTIRLAFSPPWVTTGDRLSFLQRSRQRADSTLCSHLRRGRLQENLDYISSWLNESCVSLTL